MARDDATTFSPLDLRIGGQSRDSCPTVGQYLNVIHMKFRVVSGISTVLSYIGQCDLNNICFEFQQVWCTPGRQHV